jgi:uncharacterized protein YkwD
LDSLRRLAFVAAAPIALFGLAAAPAHAGTVPPAATTAAAPVLAAPITSPTLGEQVVAMTNEERSRAGCAELTVDDELNVAAVRQSHYMAATGDFGHFGWRGSTFQARSRAAGYPAVAAENVAFGFNDTAEVIAAWMASPGHRRNIVNCDVKSFGAGVQQAVNGTFYWTQVFGWN